MLKELLNKYLTINYFDPSIQTKVGPEDFKKILEGKVKTDPLKSSVYFIVCQNGIEQLDNENEITVSNLTKSVKSVFDNCEWFGKFACKGQSQIIVPKRYDLLINPGKNQILLRATESARYYGSGFLQYDKDLTLRVLRTNIRFEGLWGLVNNTCSAYQYADSLQEWNHNNLS